MFQSFNVLLTKSEIASLPIVPYKTNLSSKSVDQTKLKLVLDKILKSDTISVSEVEAILFPHISTHVFISHSHADVSDAKKLSDFLYSQFGIKSFIDSEFWGNVDTIIESILPNPALRSEIKRYTSNAYMILGMALIKAMDKTECVFFLNTTSSVTLNPETAKIATKSPWICLELLCTQNLRRVVPTRHRVKVTAGLNKMELSIEDRTKREKEKSFLYDIDTSHLSVLRNTDLTLWKNKADFSVAAERNLDTLYFQKNILIKILDREVLNG